MEHAVFPEAVNQNGHSPESLPLPRLDPAARTFTTSNGNVIELTGKSVSSLMLERVSAEGKPRVPRVEVTLLGKHKELHANPNDPGYLALLSEWESDQKVAILRYIFVIGVKGNPPEDFIQEQRDFFPNATAGELKYLWVSSLLPDNDIDKLTEAILGRSMATEAGLQESADSFPGEDQRNPAD